MRRKGKLFLVLLMSVLLLWGDVPVVQAVETSVVEEVIQSSEEVAEQSGVKEETQSEQQSLEETEEQGETVSEEETEEQSEMVSEEEIEEQSETISEEETEEQSEMVSEEETEEQSETVSEEETEEQSETEEETQEEIIMLAEESIQMFSMTNEELILDDTYVSNMSGKANTNFGTENKFTVGKFRHAYIRVNVEAISLDEKTGVILTMNRKGTAKNTLVITQAEEYLTGAADMNPTDELWTEDNVTYRTRPNDVSDSEIMTYEITSSLCEIDITEWIREAKDKGKSVLTLHITTEAVEDGSVAATDFYSTRAEGELALVLNTISLDSNEEEGAQEDSYAADYKKTGNYIRTAGMVWNASGKSNVAQTALNNKYTAGKLREIYIRIDTSLMNPDTTRELMLKLTKQSGSANTLVITLADEYLRDEVGNATEKRWSAANLTYDNRPLELDSSYYMTYDVANSNKGYEIDISDLVLDYLEQNGARDYLTLHISTEDVEDTTHGAADFYIWDSANPPSVTAEFHDIMADVYVSNENEQENQNFGEAVTLNVGAKQHIYMRICVTGMNMDEIENVELALQKSSGSANKIVIAAAEEYLTNAEAATRTKWATNTITYSNRPKDFTDTPVVQGSVDESNGLYSFDVTSLIKYAKGKEMECMTLHISTENEDSKEATVFDSGRTSEGTKPAIVINLDEGAFEADVTPIKTGDDYYDNVYLAQKIFKIKDSKGNYLKLNTDETFATTLVSDEAAVFAMYIFDYLQYEYAEGDYNYAKTFYALKCLNNGKFLTIQNYFGADDENKIYYNQTNTKDVNYEVKASADSINWNERFEIGYYANANQYTISSHLTKIRDDAAYGVTPLRVDGSLKAVSNNVNEYYFTFEEVTGYDQLAVMQKIHGQSVDLSWYPVNGDTETTHYAVAGASVFYVDGRMKATVNGLSTGNNTVTVYYTGAKAQECIVNVRIFQHPGVTHNQEQLEAMARHIANREEPWYSDYQKMQTMVPDNMASYNFKTAALEAVGRGSNTPEGHKMINYEQGGNAAYYNALQWVITGDDRYAECTVNILNAWSNTLKMVDGRDRILGAGINSYRYINAAEIVKYYNGGYRGYSDEDFAKFQNMLLNVIYPVLEDLGAPMRANGNWDTAAMISMIAIGVVCDNTEIYDRCVALYQDIHVNGSIAVYVSDWGQSVESYRDQAHAQLGIGYMAEVCQIAENQGQDLYSLYDNRLAKAFNWAAQYNLFNDENLYHEPLVDVFGQVKWKIIDSEKILRGEFRPIYELPLSHYSKIEGVDVTWMAKAAEAMRAEGYIHNDNLNFGTLTTYSGEQTKVCEPYFQLRTRMSPWYQTTYDAVNSYGTVEEGVTETLNSYAKVNEKKEVTFSVKKAEAPFFKLKNNQDGTYALYCVNTKTYLSIKDTQIDGENIILADATSVGQNEKFVLRNSGGGNYYFVAPTFDNRVVSVTVENTEDPVNATLYLRLGTAKEADGVGNNARVCLIYNLVEEDEDIPVEDTTKEDKSEEIKEESKEENKKVEAEKTEENTLENNPIKEKQQDIITVTEIKEEEAPKSINSLDEKQSQENKATELEGETQKDKAEDVKVETIEQQEEAIVIIPDEEIGKIEEIEKQEVETDEKHIVEMQEEVKTTRNWGILAMLTIIVGFVGTAITVLKVKRRKQEEKL